MNKPSRAIIAAALLLAGACATAQESSSRVTLPQVDGGWVRATIPGQSGTGAFMRLTAKESTQLVGVASPAAGLAEVHEMMLDGDVMRMRAVKHIALPAGKTVELKPGGYHIMLLDLKQALVKDSIVRVTLLLRNVKGVESKLELKLPVLTRAPGAPAGAPAGAHKH